MENIFNLLKQINGYKYYVNKRNIHKIHFITVFNVLVAFISI